MYLLLYWVTNVLCDACTWNCHHLATIVDIITTLDVLDDIFDLKTNWLIYFVFGTLFGKQKFVFHGLLTLFI